MRKELTLLESVRKRPGMYIGTINDQTFIELIKNLLTSVIYQYKSNDIEIELSDEKHIQIIFNDVKEKIVNNHSSQFKESINSLGMDIPVLNFLSEYFSFILIDKDSRILLEQVYEKGVIKKGEINDNLIECDTLKLYAKLDKEIWKDKLRWNPGHFQKEINEFAYLNKGVKIKIKYKIDNEECKIIYKHKNGLNDWLEIVKLGGYGSSYFQTYIEEEKGEFYFEVAFAFRELSIDEAMIKSFVNDRYTHENGSHVDGLLKGVTYGVMKYFQKYDLVNAYKISEKGMEQSLVALMSVRMKNANYSGCVKNKLANPEIIEVIAKKVSEKLFEKIDKDKQSTERLIRRFEI